MRIDVVSLFPEWVAGIGRYGVLGRAVERKLLDLRTWNPRDYTEDRHRTVDDRPYGGGPGMIMKVEPIRRAIHAARADGAGRVIHLSPQGRRLDQAAVGRFAAGGDLTLLAGRYEGIDERLIELEVDEEWSIGDYVLSGGELAAMVMVDAIARLLPGVLGDSESAEQDSFQDGLLDCPHYTRPEVVDGLTVPGVLLQGHHAEIARWRRKQSLGRTWERRPDLLQKAAISEADRGLLDEYLAERAAAEAVRKD
ncbi:tRNA (guanosine(37)-N1)-methyltransferase TrmD [Acidihalobacter aeolianus]|uniref:tRNA (guanine-N(1)-)-methyltransferase n=1 Tax=Acidihalobacter aeolianus TaxID=2792603 RepID=A0A1D8K987_9GAMM|nr:tRNA (guanosine(37)-N1)-methyltransferase TrmD [Acidihalobacter aeolianus]AOV17501.1 tRNA (guanosine(37)-N1)-methyltransferase TrmD [Acidihalobacter aeolianus]